jgi:intein/homing endonuclease
MTINGEPEENLKDLFERFLNAEQAKKAVEDVAKAERILCKYPAPEPDGELIVNIKAEIAASLLRKKENAFRRIVYKTTAVAAGFILLAAIGVKLFEKGRGEPERPASDSIMPKAVWESERLADDDVNSAALIAEVEQIESDLLAVQWGENGGNGYETVTELETELIEINGDFWKG